MELVHVKCWILVVALSYVVCDRRPGFTGRTRRTSFTKMSGPTSRKSYAASGQTDEFPNELRYTMTMEDEETVDLHLVRDKFLHTPEMLSQERDKTIRRRKSGLNVAFYKDTNGYGSFACVASTKSNGDFSCSLSALLNMDKETCFVPLGSSDAECSTVKDGEIQYFKEVKKDGIISRKPVGTAKVVAKEPARQHAAKSSYNKTVSDRTKRSTFPEVGYEVVEIAYILDKAFMYIFYDRNPGDTAKAELEVDLYITLLTNEMNMYFSSIKEVSNGALDLYLFPAAVIYPVAGSDFSWVERHSIDTIFLATGGADDDITKFINGNEFTNKKWDHAMFLTGLTLFLDINSRFLGYAYTGTVCNPLQERRFSVNEAGIYNFVRIAAHEVGHALGMAHDGEHNMCPISGALMSPLLFDITSKTRDTYYKFSECSVLELINHLSSFPGCTTNNGFTDKQFKEKFCSGLPGAQEDSLKLQCQKLTGWTDSKPCNTPSSWKGCYKPYRIRCSTQTNTCIGLRYVWQGTPCGRNKVCYKGDCVKSFDVCDTTTAPCTCCGFKRDKRRERCCRSESKKHDNQSCYCCK